MAHMLIVAASQLGHPVTLLITVITGNRLFHQSPFPNAPWFVITGCQAALPFQATSLELATTATGAAVIAAGVEATLTGLTADVKPAAILANKV